MKNMKKFAFALLAGLMVFSLFTPSLSAFANEPDNEVEIGDLTYEELEVVAENLDVTIDEWINLEENLENALINLEIAQELNELSPSPEDTVSVEVSENLILESSIEVVDSPTLLRSTTQRTVTHSMYLKNLLGVTIVTLNSIGVFNTNGTKVTIGRSLWNTFCYWVDYNKTCRK